MWMLLKAGISGMVAGLLLTLMTGPVAGLRAATVSPEWAHWIVAEWYDARTGESSLAVTLRDVEAAGWNVRFVAARTHAATGAAIYDVVARRGGASVPAPAAESPIYGTGCPGYPVPPFPAALCYADGGWR